MDEKITLYINNYIAQFDLLDPNKINIIYGSVKKLVKHSPNDNIKYNLMVNNFGKNDLSKTSFFKFNVIDICRICELDMLNKIKELDIFDVPDFYYAIDKSILINLLLPCTHSLIFKPMFQARSMGKHIVENGYEAVSMLKQVASSIPLKQGKYIDKYIDNLDNPKEVFNETFNIDAGDIRDEYEKYILYNHLKSIDLEGLIVQKTVDFTHEYRVLYFKDTDYKDFVIEYREGYSPNSTLKRTHNVVDVIDSDCVIGYNILKQVKEFGDKIGLPAISLDLYYNVLDDTYGIFEYSSQFGIDYDQTTSAKISKQYTNAVLTSLKEKNESN